MHDYLCKLSYTLPEGAPHKGKAVLEKMFEYFGHIHVYSPGAGADNHLGPKYFHKHKSSVHLLISSMFSAVK